MSIPPYPVFPLHEERWVLTNNKDCDKQTPAPASRNLRQLKTYLSDKLDSAEAKALAMQASNLGSNPHHLGPRLPEAQSQE